MSQNAIEVKDVTKIYRLYDRPIDRLKESLSLTHKSLHKDFYALNGLSFTVEKGQTVGIIGTNGSGKSTILKIITGVLTPTTGSVQVDGKISALLELGAGFNMDYTGIENIYMNGTMMGYTKAEMDKKLQEILDFADIGDFVYQPVKTYSSGMFVRLAFALAINVEPEILIVDEALSVGDVFFQAKCYRRMEEIRKNGTTILMVTHDMGSIIKYCDKVVLLNKGEFDVFFQAKCYRRMEEIRKNGTTILMVTHDMGSIIKYCDKVVLLNKGEFIAEGQPGHMVDLYKKILANQMDSLKEELESDYSGGMDKEDGKKADGAWTGNKEAGGDSGSGGLMKDKITINASRTEYGDGRAEIFDLGLFDQRGNLTNLLLKGEMFTIKERIRFHAPLKCPIFTYTIKDKKGTDLSGTNTMYEGADVKPVNEGDVYDVSFTQKMTLQGGEYLLSMSCTGFEGEEHVVYHRLYDVANITVISNKNTVGVYDMESEVETKLTRG